MNNTQRLPFEAEMAIADRLIRSGRLDLAFCHLERAHVLGQRWVLPHVRSHWRMMEIGVRRWSPWQVWGQAVRIVLGALGSAVGVVPHGNTGGTNLSMFKRLPIAEDLAALMQQER